MHSANNSTHSLKAVPLDPGIAAANELPITEIDTEKTGDNSTEFLKEEEEIEFPDGGYGWVNAVCCCFLAAATFGINTTYGVYTSFLMSENYYAGGSPMRYAFVGGLSVSSALMIAPISNLITRKFGFRIPLIMATILCSLGQYMAGISKNFPEFLITQGLLFGLGVGLSFTTIVPIITQWFKKKIGIAQGITAGGSGMGGLFFSNITRVTIEKLGMRDAYLINASISLGIMTICVLLLRTRSNIPKSKYKMFDIQFVFHPAYVWVYTSGILAMMAYFVALYSMASFASHGLGLSQTKAAALQSILSAGQMVGRPFIGLNLDKLGPVNTTIISHVIGGLSCLAIWLPARSFGVLVVFALIQGIFGGTVWFSVASITAGVVEYTDYASALSIFWIAMAFASQFGQPIAVALNNYSINNLHRTGPDVYTISIGFCGGMFFAAALLLMGARRYMLGSFAILKKV